MKPLLKYTLFVLCVCLFYLFLTSAVGEEPAVDGNALFTKFKCARCHKIEMEVPEPTTEDTSEGEMEMGETSARPAPPNLWDVGSRIQDTDSLSKYLKKEIARGGRKHMMKFKGTAEELLILTEWLVSLKGPVSDSLSSDSTEHP